MPLLSYRLDESHLVVELCEVVDLDNESTVEQDLVRLLPCCGPHTMIVDVMTPLLTPRGLGVLLRVRGQARERGVSLAVVARYDTAREVLSAAGLDRTLRVAFTLQGAEFRSRGCRPGPEAAQPRTAKSGAAQPKTAKPGAAEKETVRQAAAGKESPWGRRRTPAVPGRSSTRAVGPYSDTSAPRLPGKAPRLPGKR